MRGFFGKRSTKIFLAFIALGLLTLSGIFVYYGLHLGIKPCEGLPSDAANCGDADFGGVLFLLAGTPMILVGLVGLVITAIVSYIKRNR